MKFIFFGTPQPATTVLDTLKAHGLIPSLIVTAPDKPQGRGLILTESPVSLFAKENNIPVYKPVSLRKGEAEEKIHEAKADIGIVFAYGKIIPDTIISIPTHGLINIHPSLLPLHRGPAPVEGALLAGDTEIGVSIMELDAEMDHGGILAQEKMPLDVNLTAPDLLLELIGIGAEKLIEILPDYLDGKIKAMTQDHSKATFTKKIEKADLEISLDEKPSLLWQKYRTYAGFGGVYFFIESQNKKIRAVIKKAHYEDGAFIIDRVTPEGKKEMDYTDFTRGLQK